MSTPGVDGSTPVKGKLVTDEPIIVLDLFLSCSIHNFSAFAGGCTRANQNLDRVSSMQQKMELKQTV